MAAPFTHDLLTPQQRDAVTRRGASVVLASGAGCGKTHVLTQRYLSHLRDDGAEVGQVVAITFTDRAAREMRLRIRREVRAHLDAAAPGEEAGRWERHLRGLETAQISTIHAFCATLLRQFAVEAGLDPRFDVLEDILAANLEEEALTACLQGLLTAQTPAGRDLEALVLLYGWRPVVDAVRHLLRRRDAGRRARWLAQDPESIADEWRQYARAQLLPRYVGYLVAAKPRIAGCLCLLRKTPCTGPKMAANIDRLLDGLPRLAGAADLAAAVDDLKEAARVAGTERAKAWPSEAVYETVKKALEGFREELPARLQLFLEDAEGVPEAARTGQRFVRVAEEAARAYRQLKRRHGVVDFQDLLVFARDLLRDHAAVRRRLQRRFRFVLIDELQDTDPVQMELVEHLCGPGLTEGTLFAVGDHAQSIYRFRGAEVELFQALRRRVPHEGRLGLTRNFRSQPAILDFTNALLAGVRGQGSGAGTDPCLLDDFERLEAELSQVNPGPCVEFLWSPRGDKDAVTQARVAEADCIARRVAAMVNGREALVTEGPRDRRTLRPVTRADVVLLFRALTNVELYEAALRRYGLHYYLVGGRTFFAQQEIYDLLNLLRALENPQDAVSLAGTLRSPFCCLSDESLFVLGRHPDGLWAGLHDAAAHARLPADQVERVGRAARVLDRWRGLKDRLPIARLLGEVFADSGYDAATQFEFLGERKLANLWKLVDLARGFDRSGLFGLAEFIARLGDLVSAQPRAEQAATLPESADVIRIMTIHQAKGLEFPVVVIPDVAAQGGDARTPVAHWDPVLGCVARPPGDDPPPFPEFGERLWRAAEDVADWREDLRTLYVACTRARDYLVLSAALPEGYRPDGPWMLPLAERFDLRSGRCLVDGIPPERQPRVRVTDSLTPPPAAPVQFTFTPPPSFRRPMLPASGADTALGAWTRGAESSGAGSTFQWGAEDGSDRGAWLPPRAQIVPAPAGLWDRILREVLDRWDFREPDGWRALLPQVMQNQPHPEPKELVATLARGLERFAQSEVFRQLTAAATCHRDLEFVPAGPGASPVVRAVIDCVWQDPAGAWHVLAYAPTGPAGADGERAWADLELAAEALAARYGRRPATLNRFHFEDGRPVCRSGGLAG
jgi:ATP-dependent helicase/nuclease subunit A